MNIQEQPQQHHHRGRWFQSRITMWVLLGFIAIALFFLLTEHTAHFFGILPFALFLACPLMMLFMHGGHGGHGGNEGNSEHDGPPSGNSDQTQPPEGGTS